MIKLNRDFSNEIGTDVYYISNHVCNNEIDRDIIEVTDQYTTCEAMILEQNGKYYIFGATTNTNYMGFLLGETIPKYENCIQLFTKYERMIF